MDKTNCTHPQTIYVTTLISSKESNGHQRFTNAINIRTPMGNSQRQHTPYFLPKSPKHPRESSSRQISKFSQFQECSNSWQVLIFLHPSALIIFPIFLESYRCESTNNHFRCTFQLCCEKFCLKNNTCKVYNYSNSSLVDRLEENDTVKKKKMKVMVFYC